jgi:prevent-host-death family protein
VKTFSINEAKKHLSRLVEKASRGEAFIIARAGKPLAKVVPMNTQPSKQIRRTGFLEGAFSIPEDFDQMGSQTITALFCTDQSICCDDA